MDHVAVATTMGYYQISLTRKQRAIRSVGALATDADGNPAPFTSPTAYQRASVSVPFGNCTEPSNVTAGGGACPIRFQCAGCGFYRPDPSYLPALEQHIADLRADRETARAIGAADYVQTNLTAEIDAFTRVTETMRRRLSELAPTNAPTSRTPAASCAEPAQDANCPSPPSPHPGRRDDHPGGPRNPRRRPPRGTQQRTANSNADAPWTPSTPSKPPARRSPPPQ